MGTPLCLSTIRLQGHDSERIMYGDSQGMVYMMLADTSVSFASRDMLYTEHTRDFICLHNKHTDAVTKVQQIEDVGLVTSADDCKLYIFDVQRCAAVHCPCGRAA